MQKLSTAVKDKVEAYVASGLQEEEKKINLLDNLSKAIEQIQNKFDNPVCNKIVQESQEVQDLCTCLENIFQHGLREKLFSSAAMLSEKLSFWAVLQKLSMKEDIQTIYRLSIIQTDTSRCRAWIKMKLKDNTIGSYIGLLTDSPKLLREYYGTTAFLRDMVKVESVKTLLQYVIANLDFQIEIDGGEAQQQQQQRQTKISSLGPDAIKNDVSVVEPIKKRKSSKGRLRSSTVNIAEIRESDSFSLDSPTTSQSPIPKDFTLNRSFSCDANSTRSSQLVNGDFNVTKDDSALFTEPPFNSIENEINRSISRAGFSDNDAESSNSPKNEIRQSQGLTIFSEDFASQNDASPTTENHITSSMERVGIEASHRPSSTRKGSEKDIDPKNLSGKSISEKQKIEIIEILKDLKFSSTRPLSVEKILNILPEQVGLTEEEMKSYLDEITNSYFAIGIITNKNKNEHAMANTSKQKTSYRSREIIRSISEQSDSSMKDILSTKNEDLEREIEKHDESATLDETRIQDLVSMSGSICEIEADVSDVSDKDTEKEDLNEANDEDVDIEKTKLVEKKIRKPLDEPSTLDIEVPRTFNESVVEGKEKLDDDTISQGNDMSRDKDNSCNEDAESISDDLNFVPGIHEEFRSATSSKAKPIILTQRSNTIGPFPFRSPRSSPGTSKTRSLGNEARSKMKSGTSGSSDTQDRLYGFKMNSPTIDSTHSSVNVNQALLFDADYFSDSGTDTGDSILTEDKENIKSILADLGVNDDIIGLKEDHFATPDSFMGFTSGEELELAIETCKEKIKSMSSSTSNERKNLVMQLVQLRLKLHEQKEDTSAVLVNTKKVLGHQFSKFGKAPGNYFCDCCGATIWAYVNTLYKCIDCSFHSHKKCLIIIDKPCVSRKVSGSIYITDIAPECGLSTQQYRCADCRKRLIYRDGSFQARICDYTGQFYCANCHWNEDHVIPARVIHNWDFVPRKVSRQSKHLLNLLSTKPIICLKKLNPALFNFIEDLRDVRSLREQILVMKSYLMSCRLAIEEKLLLLLKKRQHFVENTDTYTLHDLISINSGILLEDLSKITALYGKHIKFDCVICQGKGFICEICRSSDVIYPFDFNTSRCESCTSTFHRSCFRRGICPKCLRIAQRKETR